MKVGTIATMDIVKQLEESYEKVESEIFKPCQGFSVKFQDQIPLNSRDISHIREPGLR